MQHSIWNGLIAEFRALGGTADNVEPGVGPLGRGLFPTDPAKPVRIAVPGNLLIDVHDIQFDKGSFRIKTDARVPARIRAFFESYQNDLSWLGGREECEAYLEQLEQLPENIRAFLREELHFQGTNPSALPLDPVQNRFIQCRQIGYKGHNKIMPILELANHAINGCGYKIEEAVSIAGTFDTEVCAHYGFEDPWGVFQNWGFASAEPLAFSTAAMVEVNGQKLDIGRDTLNSAKRGKFRVPVVEKDGSKTRISYLLLGHARFPRAAKGIFYQLMRDTGLPNAEAMFDEIRRFNIQKFLKLLELLDGEDTPLALTLRQMGRHQIAALTHSIGTRNIDG